MKETTKQVYAYNFISKVFLTAKHIKTKLYAVESQKEK